MIDLRPASGGEKGRADNINKPIIDWFGDDSVFIYWLVAGENIFDEVGISFLVFVCI